MANKKNNDKISIFVFLDKERPFTKDDMKNYNSNAKKLLQKSLDFVDEKDKHGIRLVNQIIDMVDAKSTRDLLRSGHVEVNFKLWETYADDRRLGTIIDTMETDIDYITQKLEIIKHLS